jgi:hypothetical protein
MSMVRVLSRVDVLEFFFVDGDVSGGINLAARDGVLA